MTDGRTIGNPIIYANKTFCEMTGYDVKELIGQKEALLAGHSTSEKAIRDIKMAYLAREPYQGEITHYRKDGSLFWNAYSLSPVFNKLGELTHFVSIHSDITKIKDTQHALMLAKEQAEQATTAKTNFLATMSHEIRTPINGIMGSLNLLRETTLSPEQVSLLDTGLASSDALLEIVNDVLDMSKLEAGKIEIEQTPCSLRSIIKSVNIMMEARLRIKKISYVFEDDQNVPDLIMTDQTRLSQILVNLISNAIKFTDIGGVILKIHHLLTQDHKNMTESVVRFEVIDTGLGMSMETQSKLFKEFMQADASISRKYGGSGLGLAICKRLVQMMNGEIGVESRLGEGSRFWFVLPLAHQNAAGQNVPVPSREQSVEVKAGTLLLVEDNTTNQLVLASFARKAGHMVDIAADGRAGIEMVQEKSYDLILMDISMPGMDGMTATQAIRQLGGWHASVPIIALTALTMPGDREKCFAAGMNDYISKPIQRAAYIDTINKWLKQQPSAPQDRKELTSMATSIPSLTAPVLDPSILEQMARDVGSDIVVQLSDVFLGDLQHRTEQLANALSTSDWKTATREAHSLKSSSASCGLLLLSDLMKKIEHSLREGQHEAAKTVFGHTSALVVKSQEALIAEQVKYKTSP